MARRQQPRERLGGLREARADIAGGRPVAIEEADQVDIGGVVERLRAQLAERQQEPARIRRRARRQPTPTDASPDRRPPRDAATRLRDLRQRRRRLAEGPEPTPVGERDEQRGALARLAQARHQGGLVAIQRVDLGRERRDGRGGRRCRDAGEPGCVAQARRGEERARAGRLAREGPQGVRHARLGETGGDLEGALPVGPRDAGGLGLSEWRCAFHAALCGAAPVRTSRT